MKSKDQRLLEEAYQQINANKYKQTQLSQIVSVINESDYSINEREKLLKYVSENADSVIELCEKGGWGEFKKTLKTKIAPYALAATAALGGHGTSKAAEAPVPNQTAITQNVNQTQDKNFSQLIAHLKQTQDNPLDNWIAELEVWKKIFSSVPGDGGGKTLDEDSFEALIKGLKNVSVENQKWYNKLATSTKRLGETRPDEKKHGATARAHFLTADRFLDARVRRNPAGIFATKILALTRNTTPEKLQEIYNHFGGKEVNKRSAHLTSSDDISYIMDVLKGVPQQ